MQFEINRFPSDWGATANAARFLVSSLFLGGSATKADIGIAGLNVAGFALGQAVGQPGEDGGTIIYKLRAALRDGETLLTTEQLRDSLEALATLGERYDDAEPADSENNRVTLRKAAKQIPWFKLALAILQALAHLGGQG